MPSVPWRLAHLLALSTMAISQPLLSLLGDNPTFFTAHDASPRQIFAFALVVALAPVVVAALIMTGAHTISTGLGTTTHLGFVGLFLFVFVIQVIDVVSLPWLFTAAAAATITYGLHVLYTSVAQARSVVSLMSVLPVAVVAFFVFSSPANSVIFPGDIEAVELTELFDEVLVDTTPGTDDGPATTLAERINIRFPPVYLLMFDELPWASLLDRFGEIDAARFPNFARLGARSHVFANTTTVGLQTERAVPSLLASTLRVEAAPVYSLYPDNIFTLLGAIYDMSSSDPLVDLCPPSVCDGAPPAALLQLLAGDTPAPTTSPTTTTTTVAPQPAESDHGSSLRLLFEDAAIVFGHLAVPGGLDIGLPSIGAGWGSFGRGLSDDGPDEPTPTTTTTTPVPSESSTTTTTLASAGSSTTTTTLAVDVGIDAGDGPEVDAEALAEARSEYLDSLLTNDNRVTDMRAEIAAIRDSDVPRFHYLHVLLPHLPWRLHGDGSIYDDLRLPGYFERWDDDLDKARFGQQRHLLQLQFSDHLLGEYLDQLEEEGIFDRATIIVTADHGISFVPGGGSRGAGDRNVGGIAGVPLLYKRPGQTEAVWHDDPVSTLDIVPTLIGQLELESPWELEGYDLFNEEIPSDRMRDADAIFTRVAIPEPFPPEMQAVTDALHDVFGDGSTGSLYALAGSSELIGEPAADLLGEPSRFCWVLERPLEIPDADGAIGFVFGSVDSARDDAIDFAIVVDGTIAGTASTLHADLAHRVFALGDPAYWRLSVTPDVALHELVGGTLRPMRSC